MVGFSLPKSHWLRRPFYKFGLPFMVTIVGGSFWLRDFTQLRYTFRQKRQVSREEMERLIGVPMTKEKFNPEKELELMQQEVETDYKMLRGPRPYEEGGGKEGMALLEGIKARRQEERTLKRALRDAAAASKPP